jgi:hypothetical protein
MSKRVMGKLGSMEQRPVMEWFFPSVDGSFSSFVPVHIGWDKLEINFLLMHNFFNRLLASLSKCCSLGQSSRVSNV